MTTYLRPGTRRKVSRLKSRRVLRPSKGMKGLGKWLFNRRDFPAATITTAQDDFLGCFMGINGGQSNKTGGVFPGKVDYSAISAGCHCEERFLSSVVQRTTEVKT